VIAINTFKEAVRDKILYSLLFFAFLMTGLGSILDRITIGQTDKIIKDVGLASISLFGVLIAIFVGIGLVFKEIEKKTIYTLIAKPIARWQFLMGKYCGLLITLLVEVAFMTAGLYLFLFFFGKHDLPLALLKAIVLIYAELCVMTAVALLFSAFSTPFLSGIFTLAIFVIGHLTEDLKAFSVRFDAVGQKIVLLIYYAFPNLEFLNIKGPIVHSQSIPLAEVLVRFFYGLFYGFCILTLSILIFQKREFK
jgi:ABC-type transport system involved in multi-copper enzyme maturation permease subunit